MLGFDFICRFVDYVSKNKTSKTGVAYSHIVKKCDSTYQGVERAIRHAVTKMDKESEGYKGYIGVENTTNLVVLHTLVIRLKKNKGESKWKWKQTEQRQWLKITRQ